jgi:hypothetical protein
MDLALGDAVTNADVHGGFRSCSGVANAETQRH